MNWRITMTALCIATFAIGAIAQNTFPATGNVGIGTTAPDERFELGPLDTTDKVIELWAASTPGYLTHSYTGNQVANFSMSENFRRTTNTFTTSRNQFYGNLLFDVQTIPGGGKFAFSYGAPTTGVPAPTELMTILSSGNVGIGTTSPGAKLEINGNIKMTAGSGSSITFADGTIQGSAYTGVTCGGDYAESVDVSGDRTKYEPGDVLVIDSEVSGKFFKSSEPYSTSVTGIYSTKPGTIGRRQLGPKSFDEVPMAMIGIVPAKVSTENGPIHRGDLLVSSSTIGYAMKGTDRSRLTGAVIGKALDNLESGKGVIEVIVTLQ